MEALRERSSKHEKLGFEFGRRVSIDEIRFEELGVFPLEVATFIYMYFTASYGDNSSWNNKGIREYKEIRVSNKGNGSDMSHTNQWQEKGSGI
jgi:hypothetical protein